MKEKIKNIDFKHLFIVLLITLVIGFCVLAICLLNKYDENRSKTILNKNDDEITLNQNENQTYNSNSIYIVESLYTTERQNEYILFNRSIFGEGKSDVCSFYFNSRMLLLNLRNGIYLDDTESSYYLYFSLPYYCQGISDNFTFDVPIWVQYDFNGSGDSSSYVLNNYPTLSCPTLFNNNSLNNVTDVEFYLDVSDFLKSYASVSDNDLPSFDIYIYLFATIYDENIDNILVLNYDNGADMDSEYFSQWCYSHVVSLSNFTPSDINVYYQTQYNNLLSRYNTINENYNTINENYNTLNSNYHSLDINYQTLLEQYNSLLNSTDYSFSELFWSISAVPFGVLTSAFNINVLGVNLALNNYGFVYCYVVNLVV